MSQRIVIDPITRIQGRLRIEAQLEDATIRDAYASVTTVRGIEAILRDRDPRDAWAFAQRIDGANTLVHGLASVRAVEDALRSPVPANAELIRNLMLAAQYGQDHVMHFYQSQILDWVDVVSAGHADPHAASVLAQRISHYPNASPGYFSDVLRKLKELLASGQDGIFARGYWGHPAYRLPPEANLLLWAHALDAMAWQRDAARLQTLFGGKSPHPNLVVGGVPCAISVNSGNQAGTTLNIAGLEQARTLIQRLRNFIEQVYVPDVRLMASFYRDWFKHGEGIGNFLCYGDFPAKGLQDRDAYLLPGGVILKRDLGRIQPVDLHADDQIQEFVSRAWYAHAGGKERGLHPYQGETTLAYTGPVPPYRELNVDGQYSWLKSPRWRGQPVEVGPLARLLVLHATKNARAVELVQASLQALTLPFEALYSSMGRTLARAIEAQFVTEAMGGWFDRLLANIRAGDLETFATTRWNPDGWPVAARGIGPVEAPRGALGHWIVIEGGRITNYQTVSPCTWNAGPRDAKNQPGPYEAALRGQVLADPSQPVEILRTLHSFAPSLTGE